MTNTKSEPTPTVDMPATIHIGSDSYAAKVVYVAPSKAFIRVEYTAQGGHQGRVERFNRCADGRYRKRPYWLSLGHATEHMDPHF